MITCLLGGCSARYGPVNGLTPPAAITVESLLASAPAPSSPIAKSCLLIKTFVFFPSNIVRAPPPGTQTGFHIPGTGEGTLAAMYMVAGAPLIKTLGETNGAPPRGNRGYVHDPSSVSESFVSGPAMNAIYLMRWANFTRSSFIPSTLLCK